MKLLGIYRWTHPYRAMGMPTRQDLKDTGEGWMLAGKDPRYPSELMFLDMREHEEEEKEPNECN